MDTEAQIERWEQTVITSNPERHDAAHALFNQMMRDWNPDRARSLRTMKFLIDNYTDSDMLDKPKEGFREELQELIANLAEHDPLQIGQMLRSLNGRCPAKFGKAMLETLGMPWISQVDGLESEEGKGRGDARSR